MRRSAAGSLVSDAVIAFSTACKVATASGNVSRITNRVRRFTSVPNRCVVARADDQIALPVTRLTAIQYLSESLVEHPHRQKPSPALAP